VSELKGSKAQVEVVVHTSCDFCLEAGELASLASSFFVLFFCKNTLRVQNTGFFHGSWPTFTRATAVKIFSSM
jgi:hypothetical protein